MRDDVTIRKISGFFSSTILIPELAVYSFPVELFQFINHDTLSKIPCMIKISSTLTINSFHFYQYHLTDSPSMLITLLSHIFVSVLNALSHKDEILLQMK
jgi:hypothetical protein